MSRKVCFQCVFPLSDHTAGINASFWLQSLPWILMLLLANTSINSRPKSAPLSKLANGFWKAGYHETSKTIPSPFTPRTTRATLLGISTQRQFADDLGWLTRQLLAKTYYIIWHTLNPTISRSFFFSPHHRRVCSLKRQQDASTPARHSLKQIFSVLQLILFQNDNEF